MRYAVISAAVALFTLTNAMPALSNVGLEVRKKEKSKCDEYKKDLKKLKPSASVYCSSFIAETTTITKSTTVTEVATVASTLPLTAISTETVTGSTPTVTQTIYSDCSVVGFDNGASPAYFFDGSGALGTFDTCQARCRQDATTCLSFAVGSGQCLLYTANVAMTVTPVSTSPYAFFAVNCPAPVLALADTNAAPMVLTTSTATASGVVKRQAAIPDVLCEYRPIERSAICSCAISAPSTSTAIVSATSTFGITNTVVTTATVATTTATSVLTPAPVTVTVTTTA